MGELQQVTNLFDMTTDCKVTELFCIIDEFCKHFDAENAGNLLEDNSGVKRRRRAASLSDSEIMTILLYFHFGTFRYIPQFQALLSVLYQGHNEIVFSESRVVQPLCGVGKPSVLPAHVLS